MHLKSKLPDSSHWQTYLLRAVCFKNIPISMLPVKLLMEVSIEQPEAHLAWLLCLLQRLHPPFVCPFNCQGPGLKRIAKSLWPDEVTAWLRNPPHLTLVKVKESAAFPLLWSSMIQEANDEADWLFLPRFDLPRDWDEWLVPNFVPN